MLLIALTLAVLISACAKPPTADMDEASAALTRAETDPDAVTYGSASIIRARDALANMQSDAAAKKYDSAKTYAQEVISAADKAIADGKTGVQRARDEATNLLNSVRPLVAETQKEIESARTSGKTGLNFTALDGDFGTARTQVDQAQTALSDADYQVSIQRSQSARSILGDIRNRITQTTIATNRKK
jgi:hypothetical protein